jgi:Uma2 family endonuclease
MSTTIVNADYLPTVSPVPERLLTVADIAALPNELPSGTVDYELDNGRIVIMAPPSDMHGALQVRLGAELLLQGEKKGHGEARTEVGVILWRDPDRLVGADAAFITKRLLPVRCSPEGYLETIPDLVVEVRSKNDTQTEMSRKIRDYLKAGVRVVWQVEPEQNVVIIHRPNRSPETVGTGQTLIAEDVIPGFSLSVRDLFKR